MIPQIIHTDSFVYKAYTIISERDSYLLWVARNHEDIRKYMTNQQPFSFEQHLKFISNLNERDNALFYAVFKDEEVIGSICLNPYNKDTQEGELGKYLFPQFGGKGLGFLFAKEFIDYVFAHGILKNCVARTYVDNLRNQHVNNKLGFIETNRDVEYVYMKLSYEE